MTIRPMTLADFPEVYALWEKAQTLDIGSFESEKIECAKMITLNPTTCLVGIEHGMIIATVCGIFNGRRAWIYHLAVDPAFQKKGYGTRLLKKVEAELHRVGAPATLLWVEYENLEVLPFYLRSGYRAYHQAVALKKELG